MPAQGQIAIPDPRTFPATASAPPDDATLYALAEACLAADTGQTADAAHRELRAGLDRRLRGAGEALAVLFAGSPSVAVTRLLWRTLDAAWRGATLGAGGGLALTLFALPLVVVVGTEDATAEGTLPGVLRDCAALAAILEAHGCLAGNRSVTLAPVLVSADAIDFARLPRLLAWQRLRDAPESSAPAPERDLAPAPLAFHARTERVHLRFLVGTALAAPGVDLLEPAIVGKWGSAFTREIGRQLGGPRTAVLVLPRAPQNPLRALREGRCAQREVSAQLFASNAIRSLRTRAGDPAAVLSAHRAADAPGGGELRLSLSSPFEPREAEGFRCPLFAFDRVADVTTMLVDLLTDCRVTDVRMLRGIHPDRLPGTAMPLLFKPDTIPRGAADAEPASGGEATRS